MRKIATFTFLSVDGYYTGPRGEIDWFKEIKKDDEYDAFTHAGSRSGGALIFGRTTYEMMKSYWPTADAMKNDPSMAEVVNNNKKIVFSRTLENADEGPHWKNIELKREIQSQEIIRLKEEEGKDITILGSGSIVQQLANLHLIDEYQIVIIPVVLGVGKYLFAGVDALNLQLLEARSFKNGIVWLSYRLEK